MSIREVNEEVAMESFGVELAAALPPGAVVALNGTLGAGKTRLVQAVARSLEIPPRTVTSPTYVICQHYFGRRDIHHVDLYRVADEDAFWELGLDEFFQTDGLIFIEWAERFQSCLPKDRLDIRLEITGPTSRLAKITSESGLYDLIVTALAD